MATKAGPRLGAVIEIPTRRGLAYGQYTHWNKLMGALIRVLPGFYQSRPLDLGALIAQRELLVTFFPLEAAVREKMVEVVGQEEVPQHARKFPLFRAEGPIEPRTGRVLSWWLWDGDREWRPEKFKPEHDQLPLREVVMPPLLVSRLEEGWPADHRSAPSDASQPQTDAADPTGDTGASPKRERGTKHFLYFSREDRAKNAADAIGKAGYRVDLRPPTAGQWLLLVSSREDGDPEAMREELENLAARLGAEYDRWETALDN